MKRNKTGPFMVRQWGASKSINDAWYYIDQRGLQIVAETAQTVDGAPRRQHIVGIIPWAQIKRAQAFHESRWCEQCGCSIYTRACGPTHAARLAAATPEATR
jgi:hypothetical protein